MFFVLKNAGAKSSYCVPGWLAPLLFFDNFIKALNALIVVVPNNNDEHEAYNKYNSYPNPGRNFSPICWL